MGRSMIRMLSVVLLAIGAFSALALPGAARDAQCPATITTYELQMGPGGDFAGATVVRVERPDRASAGILQMGPGGDFAGATVVEPARVRTPVVDGSIPGPGLGSDSGGYADGVIMEPASESDSGGYADGVVSDADGSVAPAPLAIDGTGSACS